MRFEKRDDCYYDTKTGLEWSLKNCGPMTWQDSVVFCEQLGNGWRLPTIEELLTLVAYTKVDPMTELPDMMSSRYWSATTDVYDTRYAWHVYFNYGYDYSYRKSFNYYVRAVRGELKYAV